VEFRNNAFQPTDFLLSTIPEPTLTWVSGKVSINASKVLTNIGGRRIAVLNNPIIKSLDAVWTSGTNVGGRFTNQLSDTTYHVFAIFNPISEVTDIGFDTSISAVNRPSGWFAKRIGSVIRRNGGILAFRQLNHYFELDVPLADLQDIVIPTTPTLYSLSVPIGLSVIARVTMTSGVASLTGERLAIGLQSPAAASLGVRDSSLFSSFVGSQSAISSMVNGSAADLIFTTSVSEYRVPTDSFGQIQMIRAGSYSNIPGVACTTVQLLGWEDVQLYCG
jgi:hypothetical protein